VVLRECQTVWRKQMSTEHRCFKKFIKSLNTDSSKESYGYKFQKFIKFATDKKFVKSADDFEGLLNYDAEQITDILEDYVEFLEDNNCMNVRTDLASPELFFTMNRKIWHNKLVRKGITVLNRKKGGDKPILDSEVEAVYFGTNSPRKKCIISMVSSLGIRPGAVNDPVLRFKHLVPIEDCYGVMIYDESAEGYWGILIPEARKDVDTYRDSRIMCGETITDESPILATLSSRWNAKLDHITDDNLKELMSTMIRGKVKRVKTGNRYDKALLTMWRKRFNTKLKLNNKVNSNVAELVMAHKLPGAQGTYTKPTLREVYDAIKYAIPELTIDPKERQRLEIEKKQKKIDELEEKTNTITDLEEKIQAIEKRSNMQTIPIDSLNDSIKKILKENPTLLDRS